MYMGHLGFRRNGPDQYALEVLNNIFGGGFTARLMKELRSNRGLTYGIYGGVMDGRDRGPFMVSSQLKAAKFVETFGLIKGIMRDIQTNRRGDRDSQELHH